MDDVLTKVVAENISNDYNMQLNYNSYLKKYANWNYIIGSLSLSLYLLATSFVYSSTILSAYANELTSSKTLIGVMFTIQAMGATLPQIFFSRRVENLALKKPFILKWAILERFPYLIIALSIFLWAEAPKWISFVILFISLGIGSFSAGVVNISWKAMVGKLISAEKRGLFFGLGLGVGAALGIFGAYISKKVLGSYTYPFAFGLCFLFTFIAHMTSWILIIMNKELSLVTENTNNSSMEYFKKIPSLLRENPNFYKYISSQTLIIFGGMGTIFYTIYSQNTFNISFSFIASLTIVIMISQSISTPLLGLMADRFGNKKVLELSTSLSVLSILLMVFAPNPSWLYLVYIIWSISASAGGVSQMSISLEFGTSKNLLTFSALSTTLLGIPAWLAPIIAGSLIDLIGYKNLFTISVVLSLVGLIFLHFRVNDPRKG